MKYKVKLIKKVIHSIDQFGTKLTLNINQEETHHTVLGGLTTLAIYGFILYTFIQMSMEMVEGQDPNVISDIFLTKDPELFEYTPENFAISLSMTNDYGNPIIQLKNSTIWTADIEACTRKIKNSSQLRQEYDVQCKIFQMQLCNSDQTSKTQGLINQLGVAEALKTITYCIPDEAWGHLKLQGYGQSDIFSTVAIKLKACKNESSRPQQICVPDEIIKEQLNSGYLGLILTDTSIQQKNKLSPFTTFAKTILPTFSIDQYKYIEMYYRHSFIETIENFYYYFLKRYIVHHQILYESQNEQTIMTSRDSILTVAFLLDNKKITYFRTYKNILNIFADVGGILKVLMTVAALLVGPFSELFLNLLMVNNIFSFFDNQNQIEKQQNFHLKSFTKIVPNEEIPSQNRNSLSKILTFRKLITKNKFDEKDSDFQNLKYLRKFFSQKLNGLQMKFSDYFCILFGGQKRKLIKNGVQRINQKMDALYLIKKMMEIDKLKILLLSPDQIKLFNYLPKPQIQIEDQQKHSEIKSQVISSLSQSEPQNREKDEQIPIDDIDLYFKDQSSFAGTIQEAYVAYTRIKNSSNNNLNQKLVNLIEKDLRVFFEEQYACKINQEIIYFQMICNNQIKIQIDLNQMKIQKKIKRLMIYQTNQKNDQRYQSFFWCLFLFQTRFFSRKKI